MKKSIKLSICFLLFMGIFILNTTHVIAASIGFDGGGNPASGSGSGPVGSLNMPALLGCYGIKVSLVKVTNDGSPLTNPEWISYMHITSDYSATENAHYTYINGGGQPTDKFVNGKPGVQGHIGNGGYEHGTVNAGNFVTLKNLGIQADGGHAFYSNGGNAQQLNFNTSGTERALMAGDGKATTNFYILLYQLSTGGSTTTVNGSYPEDIKKAMEGIDSHWTLQSRFEDENDAYAEQLSGFSDYRMVIEPIYEFGYTDNRRNDQRFFYTMKAAAKDLSTGNLGGVAKADNFANNCHSSESHGPINASGLPHATGSESEIYGIASDSSNGYGYIMITITEEYEAKPKEYTCPDGTGVDGGTTPYITDYLFMVELEKGKHDNNLYIRADNELFVDSEVFLKVLKERFGNEENMEYKLTLLDRKREGDGSGAVSIFKDAATKGVFEKKVENVGKDTILKQDFWTNYGKAVSNSNLYFEAEKGHYYIVHSAYTGFGVGGKGWGKTEVQNNVNTTKYNNQTINIHPTGPAIQLLPNVGSNGSHSFTINFQTVDEYETSVAYAPAMYRLRYCINGEGEPPKEDCRDTTVGAECTSSGTHAVFHEDDKLTTCTLTKDNNSGFTLVDTTDTQNYCTVACKDDLDTYLPGKKSTKSGEYYVLNNNTPSITAKRTCVTTNINYSKFNTDLTSIERNIPTQYNTWHDHYEVANHLLGGSSSNVKETKADSIYTTKTETCKTSEYDSCSEKTDATERSECESANSGTYTYEEYKYDNHTYKYVKESTGVCSPAVGSGSIDSGDWTFGGQSLQDRTNQTPDEYVKEQAKKLNSSSASGTSGNSGAVGEKTTGTSTTSCCTGEGDDEVCVDKEYSWESWTIYPYDAVNGYHYSGTSGYWSNPCGKSSGTTYATGLANEQRQAKNTASGSSRTYSSTITNYSNTISSYNRCFNWNDATEDYERIGSSAWNSVIRLRKGRGDYYEDLKFDFKPTVEYFYQDKEMEIFASSGYYKYKYGSGNHVDDKRYNSENTVTDGFKQDMTYWPENTSSIDEKYTGSGKTKNATTRDIIVCDGTTCTQKQSTKFYNSAYLKRIEDIMYTYHLPDVSTAIPSGKVDLTSKWGSKQKVDLEKDASPVSITTPRNLYNYYLRISEVKDSVRKMKTNDGTNNNDKFEERFASKDAHVLSVNGGNEYTCTYNVINDIYKDKKYNFFYRVIDPLDINHPKGVPLGYNWSDSRGQKVQETMKEAEEDYQVLTNSDRDKFVFTLTPLVMKQIRNYNAVRTKADSGYADFELVCSDYENGTNPTEGEDRGYHCYSNFLTCLAGGTNAGTGESGVRTSCQEIFGSTLSDINKVTKNYGLGELRENRKILIKKQNKLDFEAGVPR